jgi:hypothetical protein
MWLKPLDKVAFVKLGHRSGELGQWLAAALKDGQYPSCCQRGCEKSSGRRQSAIPKAFLQSLVLANRTRVKWPQTDADIFDLIHQAEAAELRFTVRRRIVHHDRISGAETGNG